MNETGAILLEALVRLDYVHRARCNNADSYHRIMLYTGSNPNGHGICKNCRNTIRLVHVSNFVGWVESVFLIQEWP